MSASAPAAAAMDWPFLRRVLAVVIALFGAPSQIAARRMMPRRLRERALGWLRPLEALARKLLLLDALDAPPENVPFAPPRGLRTRTPRIGRPGFASDKSADWSVWFRASALKRKPRRRARTRRCGFARDMVSACPLAERLEALIRVARDPTKPALRRARRLRARLRAKFRDRLRARRLQRSKASAGARAPPRPFCDSS